MILKAVVIGCGNIASRFATSNAKQTFTHIGAIKKAKGIKLSAVCDLDKKKLVECQKKWGIEKGYTDFKKMLQEEKPDFLSICTPPKTHSFIVLQVANYPVKAIFCEKPMAKTSQEAKKMIKACKNKNILLMINHQRRFTPFYLDLKDKIKKGFFGQIQQVGCFYTRGIFNTGSHIIDLFNFLFGRAKWVFAVKSNNNFKQNDPNIDGLVKYKNGSLVSLQAVDDKKYLIFEIDILGSRKRLKLGNRLEYYIIKKNNSVSLLKTNKLVLSKSPFKYKFTPACLDLKYGISHIIDCLKRQVEPLSSGNEAIESVKIIEAMLRSADKKTLIKL